MGNNDFQTEQFSGEFWKQPWIALGLPYFDLWLVQKKLMPPSQPIKYKTKTNPNMITHVFPRFKQIVSFYFKFSLVEHAVNICSDC